MIAALAPLAFAIAGLAAIASLAHSARAFVRVWRALMESRPHD
jgi:hypothetical protein